MKTTCKINFVAADIISLHGTDGTMKDLIEL